LYRDTTAAVHQFVTEFLRPKPSMPCVSGGNLNAFETSDGATFIHELRQGPFAEGKDYREGEAFYVPESIVDSTFLGREHDRFKARLIGGRLQANALDHIWAKNVTVIAGTRSAAVYDADGRLVDPYTHPHIHQEGLMLRKTASDHFLNAIVFRV
ncbi:MAG: hypothetical protein WCK25_06030, partial [Actinomycetes bacterium]